MLAKAVLCAIARNDALTRGLADPEARLLVDWLIARVERWANEMGAENVAPCIEAVCARGRSIARFVRYWCHERNWGAACQLAAVERFTWELPTCPMDPMDLMEDILERENRSQPAW